MTRVGGATVTGASVAVHEPVLPDVVANQLFLTALKAFGTESAGTAKVTTTITGVRADGAAFTLRYADRFADTQSVPLAAAEAAHATLSRLVEQEFEDVRITRVDLSGSVDPVVKRYTVTRVQVKQGSRYVTPGSNGISVVPGRALPVRVTVATYRNRGPARTLDLSVKVPSRARDRVGVLLVTAGRVDGEAEGEGDGEAAGSPAGPTSFPALLAELRSAQRGYQVRAALDLEGRAGDALAVSDQSVAFLPYGDAWSVEP